LSFVTHDAVWGRLPTSPFASFPYLFVPAAGPEALSSSIALRRKSMLSAQVPAGTRHMSPSTDALGHYWTEAKSPAPCRFTVYTVPAPAGLQGRTLP